MSTIDEKRQERLLAAVEQLVEQQKFTNEAITRLQEELVTTNENLVAIAERLDTINSQIPF
ncbi:hypothetical protein [Moorena sp. SIO3I6]|uniref:hypothetical protein n=1 Tax=Moorena sp. SIO3I6 TaxID=2607831 RepID=UPI0013BC0699|nr:hypothetical protein [Moorena sp. SIO3I6]NEP23080.1 hypothetical protein [Moorena sp. SIO3I6]NEQ79400.1 hypothetical protein [Moorena sp. SIO2I5]